MTLQQSCKLHVCNNKMRIENSLAISSPELTPKASVNTRFESLESVAIATTSGINERPARLMFLVKVKSLRVQVCGRARSTVNRFFTDRCISIIKTIVQSAHFIVMNSIKYHDYEN